MKLLILASIFAFLWISVIAGGGSPEEHASLMADITRLRKEIKKYGNPISVIDEALAQRWAQLGMSIQTYDIIFHKNPAAMQAEANSCFEKAFKLTNDKTLKLLIKHRQGILLKMMSLGEEAIEAHDWAYENAMSNADKAVSLQNKGHALGMLGRKDEAVEAYRSAIELHKKDLGQYISLVEIYLEQGLNQSEWIKLYDELESRVNAFVDGSLEDDDQHEVVLGFDRAGKRIGSELTSSVYWALFLIGDKIGDYTRAWKYLERAHLLEKARRPPPMSEEDSIRQVEYLKGVFRKGFWTDPDESGIGSLSKVPVFIVGMMRSGSTLTETMLDAHSQVI